MGQPKKAVENANEKAFHSVLNRMQVGVISLDEEDHIEMINNFAKEWLGLANLELGQHKDVLSALPNYMRYREVKKPHGRYGVTVEGVSRTM